MLIWRGFGFLVPLTIAGAGGLVQLLLGEDNSSATLIYLIASVLCLILGLAIKRHRQSTCEVETLVYGNGKEKDVLAINKVNKSKGTTETIIVKDTFFGIPIVFWSIVCVVLSVVFYLTES